MIVYRQNDVEIQTKSSSKVLKEGLSTFFAKKMPTSISSSTSMRPVCTKNEHILINTIKDTTNDTINDTSIGTTQRNDKKKKGDTGGFFEKKFPQTPSKLSTAFGEQKNAVAFFALHKDLSALSVNQRSRLSGR